MARKTASFDDDQTAWLESAAEERDRSVSSLLRRLVDEARGAVDESIFIDMNHIETHQSASDSDVRDRLDELERRVDELEDVQEDLAGAGDRADHAGDPPDRLLPPEDRRDLEESPDIDVQDDREADNVDESGAEELEAALEDWNPGQGATSDPERWKAGLAALEWLRDDGEQASRSNFVEALYPELRVDENQGEDSWWRRLIRPALDEATDAGLVEYSHGRHVYRYIGDE